MLQCIDLCISGSPLSLSLWDAVYHALSLVHPHPLTGAVRTRLDSRDTGGGAGDAVRGGACRHAAVCVWRQGVLFQ